jgi:hypothetical protein
MNVCLLEQRQAGTWLRRCQWLFSIPANKYFSVFRSWIYFLLVGVSYSADIQRAIMIKKTLLFAPVTFDLAETTRMIEIAKGIKNHPAASQVFDIQFISNGGDLEHLIEEEGFPLKRLEPRFTPEKIEYFGKVDKGEIFAPAFSQKEMIALIDNEVKYLRELVPTTVITGSYMTIPVTCRILKVPLVWVIQST